MSPLFCARVLCFDVLLSSFFSSSSFVSPSFIPIASQHTHTHTRPPPPPHRADAMGTLGLLQHWLGQGMINKLCPWEVGMVPYYSGISTACKIQKKKTKYRWVGVDTSVCVCYTKAANFTSPPVSLASHPMGCTKGHLSRRLGSEVMIE